MLNNQIKPHASAFGSTARHKYAPSQFTLPPLLITGNPDIARLIDALEYYQAHLQHIDDNPTKLVAVLEASVGSATLVLDVDKGDDVPEQRTVTACW